MKRLIYYSARRKIRTVTIFDIGADGGLKGGPLNAIANLTKTSTVLFEPSSSLLYDSVDEWFIAEGIKDIQSNIDVLFLVGSHEKTRKNFYITKKPQCSSCLEPDINSISRYHDTKRFLVDEVKSFPMTTLDSSR